jgi:hypothetical protein
MAKHARSMLKKRAINHKSKSAAFTDFIDAISKARRDALRLGKQQPPTKPFIKEYNHINGTDIHPSTVYRHLNHPNTDTKESSAAKRQLLSPAEEATLVAHIHEMAARALPPNRVYIERAALEIAHSRYPSMEKFGHNWIQRFEARHQDMLITAWTKSLDTSRAAAVNPTNIKHYFDLLGAVMNNYNFKDENIYGFDETGCPFGGDETKERVYTSRGESVQHQQSEGNRENVTAMVTICADGTYLIPIAIFKGKHIQKAWHKANSLLKMG